MDQSLFVVQTGLSKMTLITHNPHEISGEEWSRFVRAHPNGNVFQTFEFFKIHQNVPGYEPVFLCAVRDNKVVGLLSSFIQIQKGGPFARISSRAIIWGGPLVKDDSPEITKELLFEYDKIVKSKALYSQVRNLVDQSTVHNVFRNIAFTYEDHLNILVNLSQSEEDLWSQVHSKRRNEIRRAVKEGTQFEVRTDAESLPHCYEILKEVYDRAKLPLPPLDYFYSLLKNMTSDPALVMFCAIYNGNIIGCMIALLYKNTIYDFYAGALQAFYKKYPNDLIPWEVIKWGKKNGYTVFDFGGAGKPGLPYGVRDYKKKFGGEFVNYGRYEKVHQPLAFKFAKFAFKLYQKLK